MTFTDGSQTEYDLGVVGFGTSKKLTTLLQPMLGERVQPVDKLPATQSPPTAYGAVSEEDKKYMKQCSSCQAWIPVAAETCSQCNTKQK